jgi:hypothetical protein
MCYWMKEKPSCTISPNILLLKKVPHRHFVSNIPKILPCYFLYDHSLLFDLSRNAWEALRVFSQEAVP